MVEMGCLDAMVGMELRGDRERRETLVYRDHLDCKVCNLTDAENSLTESSIAIPATIVHLRVSQANAAVVAAF